MTIETFVIRRADEPGALQTPGWQADGKFNANTAGEFDFVIADVNSLTILFTMLKCKLSTESVQFPARGLNTKSTSWRSSRIGKNVPSYSNVCRKSREFGGTLNSLAEGNTKPIPIKNRAGLTTIRKEYTQVSGSAGHPNKGDDIVLSNRKLLAA